MTALPQDAVADFQQRIAELERQLETAVNERDAAIERQTAGALVNFRLKNELRGATERQNASAEILNAIANTRGDAEHALQRIAEATQHFFNAAGVTIRIAEGDEWVQTVRVGTASHATGAQPASDIATRGHNVPGTVYQENRQIHIPDLENIDPSMAHWPATAARAAGIRTICGTPLRRGDKAIGALIVYRDRPAAFTDDELALQQSFADQAVIAIENARLFNETEKALARQTATSDILRVISSSPTDVQPVFDEIVLTAAQLLRCDRAFIQRHDGGSFWTVAVAGLEGPLPITVFNRTPVDPDANFPSRAIVAKETLHLPDWSAIELPEFERRIRELHGNNSALYMPLLRNGECIGLLALIARQANHFGASEITLAESFRDQALIAIENTRLFNETQEALERQTATAEILRVIASSPSDVRPVFDAIASSANRLLGGFSTAVFRLADGIVHLAAFTPTSPAADEALNADFPKPVDAFEPIQLTRPGEPFAIADTEEIPYAPIREIARVHGFRSMLFVPLMNGGFPIGVISVTRVTPGAFAPHHIQLLQTFADQAVIAIENTRLFNETREALERQTATSDILKVIASSPADVQPVFEAIAVSANRLLGGFSCTVARFIDGMAHLEAFTPTTPEADEILRAHFPQPVAGFAPFLVANAGEVTQVPDTEAMTGRILEISRARGFRSMLFAPLVNKGETIGAIGVTRVQPGAFADHHVQLLKTFADQAVIAIDNTRLFNEVRERTVELSESLQQQTATAEVLQIISSSPGHLTPVFDKMLENATRVCGAGFGAMNLVEGDTMRRAALYNAPPAFAAALTDGIMQIHPQSSIASAINSKRVVQIEDMRRSPSYLARAQHAIELAELGGARTIVVVPMLRDDQAIGVITVYRQEVRPFSEKQIDLLNNFAKQAVIAIENARLLRELRQRTDDLTESLQFQTATSDVLKVISRSPDTLQPVLDVIVETSRELCGADASTIFLLREAKFHVAAIAGSLPTHLDHLKANPLPIGQAGSILSRIFEQKRTINLENVLDDPELRQGSTGLGGARALLTVPLMQDNDVIGAIVLRQSVTRPFTPRQIQAVETFADQAVIAISNVNLFDEVQQRTRELSKSLDDLRTAQDRLVQTEKLASLGQLTAGIAHEIKNPLNFVNNFAALSAELTDELKDSLKPAIFDETIRAEVDEITGLLKDNLSKVVQHGKRADSIVKNMLLHSREGSGEHRPVDVNALVDESLNLAYHGARAEKPQFNVTLQRDFDPAAGTIEVFPQEITRVLLNLISNGFYAVTKRRADNGGAAFEPVVTATTRGRDGHVEIRIRDNGNGIPPEVKEKMFNPFFTTKPAGEGTGLGLSMSHDIVVKQHGGTIDVETAPGTFTEFRLLLPRTSLARTNGDR